MGKGHRLIKSIKQKGFLAKFAGTFLATIGLPSALLTILGKHFSVVLTIELVFGAIALSLAVNWRSIKRAHLPVTDIISGNIEEPEGTYLHCPCDLKLSDEAKRLASECYSHDKYSLTGERFEQLRIKNSLILTCLTSRNGEFLGYFDAIPLRASFAESLLRGIVTENQITHEDVISPNEMASCEYLFISGLAVLEPESHIGRRNASMLVWALLNYLNEYYLSAKPIVFAIASTEQGNDLMRRFRLPLGCEASRRIDRYPLYALRLSKEEIARRLACLPDWSQLCTLEWRSTKRRSKSSSQKHRRPPLPKTKAYNLPTPIAPRIAT